MGLFDRFRSKSSGTPDEGAALDPQQQAIEMVRAYHRATKHHPGRYARGPYNLDWETQPDPFRRYEGAQLIELERESEGPGPTFDQLLTEGAVAPAEVDATSIARLFRFSLGLSAWKVYGESRWALRMNPSSGNLHPTEGYLLAGPIRGLSEEGMVAHYAPAAHGLEVRAHVTSELWQRIAKDLPGGAFLVGLSSVLWREEWKYGERAYRYCQHDVGHAIAALSYSASCLGWSVRLVQEASSDQVASLLGLRDFGEAEQEEADLLLVVVPGTEEPAASGDTDGSALTGVDEQLVADFEALDWLGSANVLSSDHLEWDAIHACALASIKPETKARETFDLPAGPSFTDRGLDAHQIIAQRRSAVAMDGRSSMSSPDFYRLLEACMPRRGRVPFASLPWRPRVHALLFVHRVEGLERGAYVLARDEQGGQGLRASLEGDFDWSSPAGCPEDLPFFHLKERDLCSAAAAVSCEQAIAGSGAFSLGMLAEFDESLEEFGAWFYPRLFWEAGVLGQALYLEAEAAGLRGTGIGCYFDDSVHQIFGIRGTRFQSLYHFTIGAAVEDTRLQSEPPYPD